MQAGPSRNSCNRCRSKKLRCERRKSGDKKCERCRRANLDCVFGQSRRGQRPSIDASTKHVFVNESNPTTDTQMTILQESQPSRNALDGGTIYNEETEGIRTRHSSMPRLWSPTSPVYFPPSARSLEEMEASPSERNVNRFDPNYTSMSESHYHPQRHASFTDMPFAVSTAASSNFPLVDTSGFSEDFFRNLNTTSHSSVDLGSVDTFQQAQPQAQQYDQTSHGVPDTHQWNLQYTPTHSESSHENFDVTSQHLKELSDLDIELIRWASQVASGRNTPQKTNPADFWNTDIWPSGLDGTLLASSGAPCSLETTLSWTQRLYQTLRGMLRRCQRRGALRRRPKSLSDDSSDNKPIFDVPSLIHVMASYERLITVYQTTIYLFPEMMRSKPPSQSCNGDQECRHSQASKTSQSTDRANGMSKPNSYSQSRPQPQPPSRTLGNIKYNAPPPWFYSHLPKLAVGTFQPLDPAIQLDAILQVAITQLQKVGACVEELVLSETKIVKKLQIASKNGKKRGSKQRSPRHPADTGDGSSSSSSSSSETRNNTQKNTNRSREGDSEDESTGEDGADGGGSSADGDRSHAPNAYNCEPDNGATDDGMLDASQGYVVRALLQRVRRLEDEVTDNFTRLQETVRSLP